jgi:hypothetical protein
MPAIFTMREEQRILEGRIGGVKFTHTVQWTIATAKDDIAGLCGFISRKYDSYFIGSRQIVPSTIIARSNTQPYTDIL